MIRKSHSNFAIVLLSLFDNVNILRINRMLRARKQGEFLAYLENLRQNIKQRIIEKKEHVSNVGKFLENPNTIQSEIISIEGEVLPSVPRKSYTDFLVDSLKDTRIIRKEIPPTAPDN